VRTTIVSTSKLKKYKSFIFTLEALALGAMLLLIIHYYQSKVEWTQYFSPIIIYLLLHIYLPMFLRLQNVSYDDSAIYYDEKEYEVPFEDIKSVELQSLTGIYSIKLLKATHGRKEVYFKASVFYPFNFQKKDEIVEELRKKIDRYKRTLPEKNLYALPSYRL
jgi:hypothetical protein